MAAHWSRGIDLSEFGPALDTPLFALPAIRRPSRANHSRANLRTDSFGNLITNIDVSLLPTTGREKLVVELGEQRILGVSRYYGEKTAGELLALIGSSGHLEIAV